jgi:hypothetical protein
MNELASLNNVLFPRQRELRRLENLLVEVRQNFQEVARKGEDEVDERDNVSDLMTSLARIKSGRRLYSLVREGACRSPQAPPPHASGPGPFQ